MPLGLPPLGGIGMPSLGMPPPAYMPLNMIGFDGAAALGAFNPRGGPATFIPMPNFLGASPMMGLQGPFPSSIAAAPARVPDLGLGGGAGLQLTSSTISTSKGPLPPLPSAVLASATPSDAAAAAMPSAAAAAPAASAASKSAVAEDFRQAVLRRMAEKKGPAVSVVVGEAEPDAPAATSTPFQDPSTFSTQPAPLLPAFAPADAPFIEPSSVLPPSSFSALEPEGQSTFSFAGGDKDSALQAHFLRSQAFEASTSIAAVPPPPPAAISAAATASALSAMANLRNYVDEDEPVDVSGGGAVGSDAAASRFGLPTTGQRSASRWGSPGTSDASRKEYLEGLRADFEKSGKRKLSYALDVLRNLKENVRAELINSTVFPAGMKSHRLIPAGGRRGTVTDDPIAVAKRYFTSVLNKLSRDNFNKLVIDLVKFDVRSQEMLGAIIGTVFDKALEDVKYQDVYADLAKLLGEKAQEWSQKYLRVEQLVEKDAPAGAGWYYDVSGNQGEWQGPFDSRENAEHEGHRVSNFKRLLLNRCQSEFAREDLKEIMQEEAEDDAHRAARGGSLLPAEEEQFRARAQRRKEVRGAQKKRMLSNIAFIGQLYMAGMLTSPILFNCCGKLLNQGQIDTPDADDTEALCKLLTLAGGRLEEDERKRKEPQPKVQFIFTLLSMLAKHPRLESRVRFLVQGIIDLRANKWELSGSAGTIERQARTVTLEEAKKLILEEEKADKEKLMRSDGGGSKGGHGYTGIGTSARQQVVRSFGGGGSGGGSASAAAAGGGGSQDFRSVAPTRKILGPTSTLGRKPAAPAGGASAEAASGSGGASTGESGWTMVLTKGTKGAAPSAPSGREPLASAVAAPARAAAESTEAAAPGAAGSLDIKAIVLSGEALAKRTTAIVQEYTRILDAEELVRSITEIRGSPGYGRVLVQGALLDSLLSSSMRQHGGAAFVALLACGLLQRSDVVAGVAAFMATYSDQVADAPKIGDYTALVLVPVLSSGLVSLAELWHCFMPAAAAAGGSFAALLVANMASTIAAGPSEVQGRAAVVSAIASGALPLVQLCAPGMMRVRKLRQALDKGGEAFLSCPQGAVLAALADCGGAIAASLAAGGSEDDALAAWVQAQPAAVRQQPAFVRGLLAEFVFAALEAESKDSFAGLLARAANALALAFAGAELGTGDHAAENFEAFALSGAQLACAADESFAADAPSVVFAALLGAQPPLISTAGMQAWLTARPGVGGATGASAGAVAEPLGRAAAEVGARAATENARSRGV